MVELTEAGRPDVVWFFLHPLERAAVPVQAYVACERRSPSHRPARVRVVGVRAVAVAVPGLAGTEPGWAVRLRTTAAGRSTLRTLRVVPVEGRYTWILERPALDAYRLGRCS